MPKTCIDFEVDLVHYADGLMGDVKDKAGLEEHLKGCETCQKTLQELKNSATFMSATQPHSEEFQKKMDELKKKSETQLPPQTAEELIKTAENLLEKKDYVSAIALFDKVIELKPDNIATAYFRRGSSYYHIKQYNKAIADFTLLIKLYPQDMNMYGWRGRTYLDNKQHDKSISDFSKIIGLEPGNANAYLWRGISYYENQEYDKAIIDFSGVIKLNPKDASAYWWRGFTCYGKKEYSKAIIDFSKTIELNPKDASAYRWRGMIYQQLNKLNEAIKDFTKTVEIYPKDGATYLWRGMAYQKLGEVNRAVKDFEKALKINPTNKTAQKELISIKEEQARLVDEKILKKLNLSPEQIKILKTLAVEWDKEPIMKQIQATLNKIKKTYVTKEELEGLKAQLNDLKMPTFKLPKLLFSQKRSLLPSNRNRFTKPVKGDN